jgi:hypothetical protein
MRLAEKIRTCSIQDDVKAADEVKLLGLIATETCTPNDPEKKEGARSSRPRPSSLK